MIAYTYITFAMFQVLLHVFIQSSKQPYEEGITIVVILQMRILNHGEVK